MDLTTSPRGQPAASGRLHLISLRRGAERGFTGRDEVGGKAQGLLAARPALAGLNAADFGGIEVEIPAMTVLGTSVFDAFMQRNRLYEVALSDLPDERIAHAFQRADMPFEALGELRALVQRQVTPLAVRSSGLLEDVTRRPFAGVYLTKMIPNNAPDAATRFQKLLEAIKFVWASTYFKVAKDYCQATGLDIRDEKMAVILQSIVGKRRQGRFYPELSGVARSFNYYPVQPTRPEDGVVSLALGLGKTIVDGGRTWVYSPAYPERPPPYPSARALLDETQTRFWVVEMGEQPEYNPIKETEYLRQEDLSTAERDGVLHWLASTYDLETGQLTLGTGARGPRVLTFAPLLQMDTLPFNRLVRALLSRCEQALGHPVEIEFAMTFDPPRFGFLQVRPMIAPAGEHQVSPADLRSERALAASDAVLGNGVRADIADVVYVIPERFDRQYTPQIAAELAEHNRRLLEEKRPYALIVFGRLGTFDPWLGIPITWGQVCGAAVIVEATRENVRVELSQGSHYFHNIINLGVMYFSMPHGSPYRIDWAWLERQPVVKEGAFTRHARLPAPLRVRVDGRAGRGLIEKPSEGAETASGSE